MFVKNYRLTVHNYSVLFSLRYEHVVYILDSLIYTLTNWPKAATPTLPSPPPTTTDKPVAATLDFSEEADDAVMADEEDEESSAQDAREKQKSARFFERSESITIAQDEVQKSNEQFFGTPGSPGGQSSGPLQEAFPLAKQPHLLRSNAKKEQLFSKTPAGSGRRQGRWRVFRQTRGATHTSIIQPPAARVSA